MTYPTYSHIRCEVYRSVLTITIWRAAERNTITYMVLDELLDVVSRAERDDAVRVVVVTGQGEWFSAGTDLASGPSDGGYDLNSKAFKPLRGGERDIGGELALKIFDSTMPFIAAINGTAVGIGMTMTLPMDIRIASDTARFGLPFVRRGILPESCSTWFLPRIVGISAAVDWAVTGRIFDVTEAFAAGLVREVVPQAKVLSHAQELAAEIAQSTSAVSVALTRQLMWQLLGSPHPIEANRLESEALLALGVSTDAREGVAAFREKRPAHFTSTVGSAMPAFFPWWKDKPFRLSAPVAEVVGPVEED